MCRERRGWIAGDFAQRVRCFGAIFSGKASHIRSDYPRTFRAEGRLDEAPNRFRARWNIRLLAPPVIDATEELIRCSHLENLVMGSMSCAEGNACIDMMQCCMSLHAGRLGRLQHPVLA